MKAVRFIAKNADDAALLRFEEVAMSDCAVMHRKIKSLLVDAGIGVAPLMLMRVHTAKEPYTNVAALANDPQVEVIIFSVC